VSDERVPKVSDERIPLEAFKAGRKKRQLAEQRVRELEETELHRVNKAFRIALVALGADPQEIIAEMNR
jgi:hypothetical protein